MAKKKEGLSRRDLLTLGGAAGAALLLPREARAVEAATATPPKKPAKKDAALPQVPRRILGKTGESIPILLFGGGVPLDPRFDPKLAEALRFGVNYVDAADCYSGGSCEPAVASFHERAKARDRLWITSKSDAHDPEGFEETLEKSLSRLKTDHVDLYFLHALQEGSYLSPEFEKTVARLKKAGKLKYFGFSCHHGNVAELMQQAAKLPWIDAIMFRYNFRMYGDEKLNAAIDACHAAKIGLIAMKTQGSEVSFQEAWKKFEKTGKWNKHQAVLKAVWADSRITAAVSAMDTFEKLKENIAAALDDSELGLREVEALRKYADATRGDACDGCDHLCNPAVDGEVQIGTTLRYLMYHDAYGEAEKAQRLFRELPEGARRLAGIDFEPAKRVCPHGVDVVALMERARQIFVA
ncbi:MAG: aldo/keto reductase [Deltaproteobacteria bacterium]|nr:aldo/keto reductase [Deltaproteobacteria bacterium]